MTEQRILITGGTSGIGLATACRFAGRNARVAVLARDQAGLEAARKQTARAGRECLTYAVDVTDRPALSERIEGAARALGGLDVVVANVGASTYARFSDTPPEDFDRVLAVSFRGVVDTTRAALPHLESSGGSLVVVGSMASAVPLPRMSAYTAAKHAVRGFVDTLRIELAAAGSRVSISLIEPGPVDTPFWHNVANADGLLPPGPPLTYRPEEVARAIEDAAANRRTRTAVGGTWWTVAAVRRVARPLVDGAIVRGMRFVERRGKRGPGRAAIWNPSGRGELRLGLKAARPSLLVRVKSWLGSKDPAGSAPPRIDGICEMTLQAKDPQALSRFYIEVFGCEPISREDERIWLACGSHSRLGIWSPGEREFGDRGGRHVHFALSCTPGGIDAFADRLRELGVGARGPVEHDGGDRSLYIEDPEGNIVEVWDFFRQGEGARRGVAALD